ncbi:MAG: hypothetical protein ACJATI_001205 [Halioglobus sp.]|jgi:hypothetical protein
MSASGFQLSMARTIKSNAQLLNRNNLFAQLKIMNNKTDQNYTPTPMPKEALVSLRMEERSRLKNNLIKRRIIGVIIIIPVSIILMVGIYLLMQALM